jgi:hypothetical protein
MKKAMPKSPGGKRPGAGRPATGKDPQVVLRMPKALISSVDSWAQASDIGRSEAIRRLVKIGLSSGAPRRPKRAPRESAARAAELAAKVIDRQIAPETPAEERAVRKRKLLQGPSIVREVRRDRPK